MQDTFHCLACGDAVPIATLQSHLEWHHVTAGELSDLLNEIRRQSVTDVGTAAVAYRDAGDQLDAAVGRARAAGASWTDVGKAAGITRQSARERWSR